MPKKALLLSASTFLLSACVTLYTTSRDFRLPGGLSKYDITATLNVGLFFSSASIAVNGNQVLSGESAFLGDTIAMNGSVDGLPIEALCNKNDKKCDVRIAGIHAATLNF